MRIRADVNIVIEAEGLNNDQLIEYINRVLEMGFGLYPFDDIAINLGSDIKKPQNAQVTIEIDTEELLPDLQEYSASISISKKQRQKFDNWLGGRLPRNKKFKEGDILGSLCVGFGNGALGHVDVIFGPEGPYVAINIQRPGHEKEIIRPDCEESLSMANEPASITGEYTLTIESPEEYSEYTIEIVTE